MRGESGHNKEKKLAINGCLATVYYAHYRHLIRCRDFRRVSPQCGHIPLIPPIFLELLSRVAVTSLIDLGHLDHNLLSDLAILCEDDFVDFEGGLDGVGLVVDPLELLESTALGLDTVGNDVLVNAIKQYKPKQAANAYPKRYQQMASITSQATNTKMYLYLMFSSAIGPAKRLMNPMALTMNPDRARPLARVVVSRASVGMAPCSGV